jgi:hypothetical protein
MLTTRRNIVTIGRLIAPQCSYRMYLSHYIAKTMHKEKNTHPVIHHPSYHPIHQTLIPSDYQQY